MSEPAKPRALGRGLSALLGDGGDDYGRLDRLRGVRSVAISLVQPGPTQPRRRIDDSSLEELALSIAEKGVLQPILVRRSPADPDRFEIVAGERRWRAAQRAQLHEIPVLVREFEDGEALEVALIENLQRQDLNPVEEAEGYRRLLEEFGHSQEAVAKVVGKSRSHVANTLRLLGLPPSVLDMLRDGALTAGHARALAVADDPEALARAVVRGGLNVRRTEDLVRGGAPQKRRSPPPADPNTEALERDLSALLGMPVQIRFRGQGGQLVLSYQSLAQLDDILRRLNAGPGKRPGFGGDGGADDGEPWLIADGETPEDGEPPS